ncbi:dihydrofolate reductase [bacterium]|nr:dihydrofolate reductase [Alphaproteobacteria bacterium]MDC0607055.1 dihydrofolate reductase [bacterium]MDC1117422.1 dihydrofolate reductase [Alphaproteobacteria bacterium]
MIKLIVAVGRNGEIGLEGRLPWEGTFIEDQQWYLNNTLNAVRVGCSGSITTIDDKRAFYIVSARNIVAPGSLGIYNWRLTKPHEILCDVQAKHPTNDVFVVGGVPWYEASAHAVEQLLITRINGSYTHDRAINMDILLQNRKCMKTWEGRTTPDLCFEIWE